MKSEDNFYLNENPAYMNNARLSAKSRRRLSHQKSNNTIRAYNSDWNNFVAWCREHDEPELPTTPETLVNYINDLADTEKANTLSRRLSAISENHIAAGYRRDNPAKNSIVHITMTAIRREKGTFQKGKTPILPETLSLFADLFGTDLISLRDRALIFLGFAGAFRRSELVAIKMNEVEFLPEGMTVFIPHSKTDQLGEGSVIAVPYAPKKKICAVRAVKEWINQAHLTEGYLFRGFYKGRSLREKGLSDQMVARIVKKYADMAGLTTENFAGHSLRRGFATSAAQNDANVLTIMRQTRHKTVGMVQRYVDQGNAFKNNALQNIWHSLGEQHGG